MTSQNTLFRYKVRTDKMNKVTTVIGKGKLRLVDDYREGEYNFVVRNDAVRIREEDGNLVYFCDGYDIQNKESRKYLVVKFEESVLEYDLGIPEEYPINYYSFAITKYTNDIISITKNF